MGIGSWFVAAIGWLIWYWHNEFSLGPWHVLAAGALVLSFAILARVGWLRFFGPVFSYEVLRAARRTRFFLVRWLYAVFLLLLLLWVYWIWSLSASYRGGSHLDVKEQAKLAETFFYAFAVVQFFAVVLLTPAYVAGGIAEEKERKTLDFLLATDLNGREIIFGKLLARLGNLGLFLLTGLPMLSLMQFFGGIDPGLLLASFAVTALTAISLASLGILYSTLRRRARDAIVLTYLTAFAYAAISGASWLLPIALAAHRLSTGQPPTSLDSWLGDMVGWFNTGNPFSGFGRVLRTLERGAPVPAVLLEVVEQYALFHIAFSLICVTWAVVRLRPIALAQAAAVSKVRSRFQLFRRRKRPPVTNWPMLWKEVRIEAGLKFGWFGRIAVGILVGLTFVPVVMIFHYELIDRNPPFIFDPNLWRRLAESVNVWLRAVNVLISTLMLLGVAVRASGSVSGERDRDTLTSLMTTPLTSREIFWAKWIGSIYSIRAFLLWLAVVWLIGLVTRAVQLWAIPLQIICWLAPAAFIAGLGLYLSAHCKSTLRATTWTIVWTLLALGGHWIVMGMCVYSVLEFVGSRSADPKWVLMFELGLTPPFLFGWLPAQEGRHLEFDGEVGFPILAVFAQFVWCIAAMWVGYKAWWRFCQLTNRNVEAGHPSRLPAQNPRPRREDVPFVIPMDPD